MDRSYSVRAAGVLSTFVAVTAVHAVVLDPPSFRCVSVNLAGDAVLTWVAPPDPNADFANYEVWWSASLSGPYALLTTIPVYGTPGWTHFGAGANNAPQFYYLTTVSASAPPNTSVSSDTLSTMHLTVGQSTPLGSALLDWTPQHVPPIATASANVDVQLEHPIGTWSLIHQQATTDLDYAHVISICEDSLTYRIGLTNTLGCVSYSNRAGDVFADATPPGSPVMVTVSVDTATGLATLDWAPSPEDDTNAYIIVLSTPGGNVILDTIYGQFNTSYTWLASNASGAAESFTVAAFDTCWSGTPASPNTSATLPPHTTIHTTTQYDKCEGRITVAWTPYVGWAVQSYEVYAQKNGGAVFLLGNFPASASQAVHFDVDPFATYCYVVKAIRDGGGTSSLSNKACRITDYPPVPTYNYLRTVTVVEKDHIMVVDSVDGSAEVKRYRFERSRNGEPYQQVATFGGGAGPVIAFHDLDVDTDQRSYLYRVVVDDSCGNELITSNEGTSIFLRAEADLSGFNRLVWNGYEDWAGVVSGYAIHRAIGTDPYQLIAVNGPTEWTFTDDVRDLFTTTGRFCYKVEALETLNPSGIDATAMSNEACAIQQEQVWIPNAFIAGGANDAFIPVIAYVDVSRYEFTIINRWGQEIWTTNDPTEAWKGTINGAYVPQGVYAYYCSFLNGAGQEFVKRGTVTFLHALTGE